MPTYSFTAASKKGELSSGSREAKNEHELAQTLRQEGYILISADLKRKVSPWTFSGWRGVPLNEKIMFTRSLAIMIAAGVPLPRNLKILSQQTKSKRLQNVLIDIENEVIKGKNLSDALVKHPNIFSELFCAMIKVGEETGRLEEVLKNLTTQMEKEYELRAKIMGAMLYPAVIISAMIAIAILMLIVVIPNLAATFQELNVELPATTKMIINLGLFFSQQWYLVVLIIVGLVFTLQTAIKRGKSGKIMGYLLLTTPVVGPIVKKTNTASMARTLSTLISTGIPLVRSLKIISNTLGNFYFRKSLADAEKKIEKGGKLSEALNAYQKIYPSLIIQMIAIGEETGRTPEMLDKLANFYEEEVANATKNLTSVIEPILMIIIGAAVGFFAISIIQPMYSMMGSV